MSDIKHSYSPDEKLPTSGLTRRLAALVYDLFLLLAMIMAYALCVITPVRVIFYGAPQADDNFVTFPTLVQIILMIGLLLVLIGYYLLCWRKQGQSMGMKAWRLKLQQPNGELATLRQCWLRAALAPLSLGFFGIGYLWCLIPPARECLHDRLSGTHIVVIPKDK
jgi:uncharacterized RDD family membrane protein YckC